MTKKLVLSPLERLDGSIHVVHAFLSKLNCVMIMRKLNRENSFKNFSISKFI